MNTPPKYSNASTPAANGAVGTSVRSNLPEPRSGQVFDADLDEAQRFLDVLGEPPFTFQVFPDRKDTSKEAWYEYGTLEQLGLELVQANRRGLGVFVTVNRCNGKGREKRHVVLIRSLFVDLDGAPLEPVQAFRLPPHMIVESSRGRYHAYWKVADFPLDEFTPLQKNISTMFGGDSKIHDLSRVMRLPGFWHQKGEPFQTRLVETEVAPAYTVDQVRQAFPMQEARRPPRGRVNTSGHGNSHGHQRESRYLEAALQQAAQNVAASAAGERNDTLNKEAFSLGRLVAGAGLDEQMAYSALLEAGLSTGLSENECRTTIASGLAGGKQNPREVPKSRHAPPSQEGPGAPQPDGRPNIQIAKGALPEMVEAAVEALEKAGAQVFDRGGALVRPIRLAAPQSERGIFKNAGALILVSVTPQWLQLELAKAAVWCKFNERKNDLVLADPPKDVTETLALTSDLGPWPYLRAVVQHPVLFQDGRRLATSGYDSRSGLYLDITGTWPSVPQHPTRDDAVRARKTMEELLRFYPFASETDRAVALSMFLTGVMRPALDLAPGHAIDAPVRGSGKSLMIDAVSILMTGTTAPALEYSRDETEMTKRLDGALLAGDSLIAVDNIEGVLEGAALNSTLSQHTRQIRPLGGSRMVVVPCTAMLTFTGNNLLLKGDITRRLLVARLLPETERPELRDIPQNLRAEVRERRGELLAALHTIVAAYVAAGSPRQDLPPYGGFEQWDRTVRHALVWSGAADPLACQNQSHEDNPEREAMLAVFEAWYAAFGDDPTIAASVCKQAAEDQGLRDALAMVAHRRGELNASQLGYWLRRNKDGRAGGYVLRRGDGRINGAYKWRVCKTEVVSTDGVDSVDVTTQRTEIGSSNETKSLQNHGELYGESTPSAPSTPEVTFLESEPDDELEDDLF